MDKFYISRRRICVHFIGVVSANYCVKNDCYARSNVTHRTLQVAKIPDGLVIGRTTEEKFTFKYGPPEEMYQAYKKDIEEAKNKHDFKSTEFVFHPGYAGEFEKPLTSFIQERIDDVNFLLSDYFLKLIKEEELILMPSSKIVSS